MATDYISREAAVQSLTQTLIYKELVALATKAINSIPAADVVERASGIIGVIPAADVRPVVKATWIVKEMQALFPGMDEHPVFACSECGYQIYDLLGNVKERHHFCPNCGADIREES